MTLQRIGGQLVEHPVEVVASATVDGVITNRVMMRGVRPVKREASSEPDNTVHPPTVKKPKKSSYKRKRYRKDKTVEGRGRKKVYLNTTPALLCLLDSSAERREIARSELVRLACTRYFEAVPATKEPTRDYMLLYCISLPPDVLAVIDDQANQRGLTRCDLVRRALAHFHERDKFPTEW